MRALATIASLLLMVLAVTTTTSRAQETDDAAINKVFADFTRIWDEPGLPGFENLFTEDADFVVITGRWLKGRAEIAAYHRQLLTSVYAGSTSLPGKTEAIRFLRPDLVIAHRTSGATFELDGKPVTRTGLATAILVKQDGVWRITAFHNTLTSGPGALTPKPQ